MKKINLLLLSLLVFGSVMAQNMSDQDPSITKVNVIENLNITNNSPDNGSKEMWDVVWTFQANAAAQPGIETNGTYVYCPTWNSTTITRYDMDGANATDFIISGVANLRDLAYDGTYFYGAAADMNLKVMDLDNETLIETISVSCGGITGIRHIAYDPTLDANNGGFWIGNWAELGAIDMEGNELIADVGGNESCYGSAYDDSNPGAPVLWLFQQVGAELVTFQEFDINTLTYTSNTHEATDVPGYEPGDASLAGGACTWDDPVSGSKLLIGTFQQDPNLIFAYDISDESSAPVFEEKFDTYTAGEQVACQNPEVWTTWSNAPCGADDPFISDEQSYSGPNSVNIVVDDDLVLDLPEYITSGRYTLTTMVYVPTGGLGYYNVMASFQAPQEWAFEVYFNAGGDGNIGAGGEAAATFDYEFDTWMESKIMIDLNADWAEYYLDGTLIHSWQWTLGAAGDGCALQLGALDFYGPAGANYYFDDLAIYVDPTLPAPSNLTADVIDNSVELNWTAAPSKGLIGYNVYRDGDEIATEISEVTYTDNDLLPGTYAYDVKAIHDEGVSAGAGPVEAVIEGGVDRELVIIEVATGTWCQYCPGAAMGVDEMHAEGLSVGIIEYHNGDNYTTDESDARNTYYAVSGYPTANFNGGNAVVGGSATASMYPNYLPIYEEKIAKPSLFDVEAQYSNIDGENYHVTIAAEMIEEYPWLSNDIVLQVALTESHIDESWQNQSELNFVCRDMIPTQNGTSLDFEANASQSVDLDFTIPSSYNMSNIELIVFIQDNTTKEILQGVHALFITGVENIEANNEIDVYPNPATDFVNISASMDIQTMTVFNHVGQVVFVKNIESNSYKLNTNNFQTGLYVIQLETENGTITKRIVIE